ncbi:MAG: hypothetical protein ACFFE5_08660, partial [Candidatus Thorarchaeota archaeon]
IDKMSHQDQLKNINLFIESAKEYGMDLIHLNDFDFERNSEIPYLEFSVLKKTNLGKLKSIIQKYLHEFL